MLLDQAWPALCSHCSPGTSPMYRDFYSEPETMPASLKLPQLWFPCHILHITLVQHFLVWYIHLSLPHLLSIFLTQHRTEQTFMFLLPKPLQENISFSQNLLLGTTALSKASSCSVFGISCKDVAWSIPLLASYLALAACPQQVWKSRNSAGSHVSFLSSQSVPCGENSQKTSCWCSKGTFMANKSHVFVTHMTKSHN